MKIQIVILSLVLMLGFSAAGYYLGREMRAGELAVMSQQMEDLSGELKFQEGLIEEQDLLLGEQLGSSWRMIENIDNRITRRHLILSIWYLDPRTGRYLLGREMNHAWLPVSKQRNPIFIIEEELEVMEAFMRELHEWERESSHPPQYPTQDDVDPRDGSRVLWENIIEQGDEPDGPTIWFGRSKKDKAWMAYEYGKGVYVPDAALRGKIEALKEMERQGEKE